MINGYSAKDILSMAYMALLLNPYMRFVARPPYTGPSMIPKLCAFLYVFVLIQCRETATIYNLWVLVGIIDVILFAPQVILLISSFQDDNPGHLTLEHEVGSSEDEIKVPD